MALEIERRFLVTDSGWRGEAGPPQMLRQGYLSASPEGFTVRMRLRADGMAWLTLKTPAAGIARTETYQHHIIISPIIIANNH